MMKKILFDMKRLVLSSILLLFCHVMSLAGNLIGEINTIIRDKKALVGVAIICGDKTFTVGNEQQYPIMSVFKLHVTLAALNKMERDGIPLDKKVHMEKAQILEDTYSPLREQYPHQSVDISYRNLITYTISQSDNNTCDWLIKFVGGINVVDAYVKSLGITGFNLTETEESMHEDIMTCYHNWSTPLSVAQLLKAVYTEKILTDEHFTFLESTMLNCASGKDKLKSGLPIDIKIAHKTGHSDRTADGVLIGDTDAGVIYLPDGEKCYAVVLIKDALESDSDNAKIMGDICRLAYQYFNNAPTNK